MTSNYRSPIYDIPFSGIVPPNIVGDPLDDDFSASRPAKEVSGTVVPGYVELASKWKVFDPDGELTFSAIDPRLQMALLSAHPEKAWCGIYQDLPFPTTVGQTLQLAIYTRATLAFVESAAEFYDALRFGLILGQDLQGAPTTSAIVAAHAELTKAPGDDAVPTVEGLTQATVFASFDAFGTPGGRCTGCWPASCYLRMRLLQRMDGVGSFAFQYAIDSCAYGQDWVTLVDSSEVPAQPAPFKSIGLGMNGDGNGFGAYFDLFRVLQQPVGALTQTIGGTQQLGAV